jgi:hypothetical protein
MKIVLIDLAQCSDNFCTLCRILEKPGFTGTARSQDASTGLQWPTGNSLSKRLWRSLIQVGDLERLMFDVIIMLAPM